MEKGISLAFKKMIGFISSFLILMLMLTGAGDFVLCLGADGHTEVEFAKERECAPITEGSATFSGIKHCGTCTDIPISISAQQGCEASKSPRIASKIGNTLPWESLIAYKLVFPELKVFKTIPQAHSIQASGIHRFVVIRA